MADPRTKIVSLIKTKSGLDDINSKDLEIGIYNWCIEYCDQKKIFKNWKNNRFTLLYLEKARSIITNITKESYLKNDLLIERLKNKEFLPHDIAFMKPDALFPERWRDTSDALLKKYEHAYENRVEAMSEDYLCLKCKQRKVVYQEIFSRSADEAGVIHIRCINCGNRWKIG
jgi:DNA-directed RNA polymerase subunit M/transcription elongation factor TFIIS